MKIINTITLIFSILVTLLATDIKAQETVPQLTIEEQQTVLDSISSKLNANYVFPEVAAKMVSSLQSKIKKGKYTALLDPQEFANTLTTDLQAVSKDKHIRVSFDPRGIAEQRQTVTPQDSIAFLNRYINNLKQSNFGFKEVKILAGNIGYLDLRSFSNVEYGGETAVAAMNFLSNTEAIIIDLRFNGGGSPAMIQLISSYLFGSEPVHLNNFYWRPTDAKSQTWTLPHVSGTRSPDTPVYVLTSSRTFSAAEEFSYNLKNLERATLIGETTGGGAHPGGYVTATDRFMVWVPTGRAINPITNTNWEGTGVSPHIAVPANDALSIAQIKALELLKEQSNDMQRKSFYNWNLSGLKAKQNPREIDIEVLKSYVGTYGPRKISREDNTLIYQRDNGSKYPLIPVSDTEFLFEHNDTFRVRFIVENGKTVALEGRYDSGRTDMHKKQ